MSNSTVSKFWEDVETAKLSGDFVDLSESAQASAFAPEFGDRDELITKSDHVKLISSYCELIQARSASVP
jgi:hypothetical protein